MRVVLEGFRREVRVSELCRRERINPNGYYSWLKDFMEAGKLRLQADTARDATRPELKSRVTIFGALTSLTRDDTAGMIRFRYRAAGGEEPPFTPAATDAIFRYSTGLPRLICTLCNTALTKAFATKSKAVEVDLVNQAAAEMRVEALEAEREAA